MPGSLSFRQLLSALPFRRCNQCCKSNTRCSNRRKDAPWRAQRKGSATSASGKAVPVRIWHSGTDSRYPTLTVLSASWSMPPKCRSGMRPNKRSRSRKSWSDARQFRCVAEPTDRRCTAGRRKRCTSGNGCTPPGTSFKPHGRVADPSSAVRLALGGACRTAFEAAICGHPPPITSAASTNVARFATVTLPRRSRRSGATLTSSICAADATQNECQALHPCRPPSWTYNLGAPVAPWRQSSGTRMARTDARARSLPAPSSTHSTVVTRSSFATNLALR